MKHLKKPLLIIALGMILTACGDGGDSTANNYTPPNTNQDNTGGPNTGTGSDNESTGSVLEKLDTSKTYKILYAFPSSDGQSTISSVKQNSDGVITEFGSYKLEGPIVAKEIAGNKNYAIARITKGLIVDYRTDKPVSTEVSKYVNGSYFYFAFNPLLQKRTAPVSKQINCTDLHATQAKVTNGASRTNFITPTIHNGSMTLNPNGMINVAFTVKNNSDETSFASEMDWVENFDGYNSYNLLGIKNTSLRSVQIGTFNIADNGPNSLVVGAIYNLTLGNGAAYEGAMTMTCNY